VRRAQRQGVAMAGAGCLPAAGIFEQKMGGAALV